MCVGGPIDQYQGIAHQLGEGAASPSGESLETGVELAVEVELCAMHAMYIHRLWGKGNAAAWPESGSRFLP